MAGIVIAGRGSLRVGSKTLSCTAIKATIGAEKRTKVLSMDGPKGDKVEAVAPKLTATVVVTDDVSMDFLSNIENETVEGQTAGGRSFVFEGASITDPPEYDVGEGTCDLSFEALSAEETGV
jgi:hypothetical protein